MIEGRKVHWGNEMRGRREREGYKEEAFVWGKLFFGGLGREKGNRPFVSL